MRSEHPLISEPPSPLSSLCLSHPAPLPGDPGGTSCGSRPAPAATRARAHPRLPRPSTSGIPLYPRWSETPACGGTGAAGTTPAHRRPAFTSSTLRRTRRLAGRKAPAPLTTTPCGARRGWDVELPLPATCGRRTGLIGPRGGRGGAQRGLPEPTPGPVFGTAQLVSNAARTIL
jgi:hypothetical protein